MSDRIDLHLHTAKIDDLFQTTITASVNAIVNAHNSFQQSALQKLDDIITRLDNLKIQETSLMATVQDLETFVTELNDETNGISDRLDRNTATIDALKLQISQGTPVTQEQLDALAAGFTPISARLRALGADPTAPIPPAEPPVA